MAQPNLKITFEIEPIVKLHCACLACQFNVASGNHIMTRDKTVQPEGFCLLKHIVIDEDGQCADKRIAQTGGQGNSDYYASRQYTCRDGEERCKAAASIDEVGVYKRCTLPNGHQGKHLTADDVEF